MIEQIPNIVILIFSVVFHEVAHGWVALKRGDTTARDAGRLTLNPISHIDPFGTILLPLFLFITRAPFLIGAAKPVPINPWNFRNPKKDMALVGASGPMSNFFLAVVASILFRIFLSLLGPNSLILQLLVSAVVINLVLGFFNLIPIPPLDGSRILMAFLPKEYAVRFAQIERYGIFIVFILLFLGFFRLFLLPLVQFFLVILIG